MKVTIGGTVFEAYINQGGGVTLRDPARKDEAVSASVTTEALLLFAILERLQALSHPSPTGPK